MSHYTGFETDPNLVATVPSKTVVNFSETVIPPVVVLSDPRELILAIKSAFIRAELVDSWQLAMRLANLDQPPTTERDLTISGMLRANALKESELPDRSSTYGQDYDPIAEYQALHARDNLKPDEVTDMFTHMQRAFIDGFGLSRWRHLPPNGSWGGYAYINHNLAPYFVTNEPENYDHLRTHITSRGFVSRSCSHIEGDNPIMRMCHYREQTGDGGELIRDMLYPSRIGGLVTLYLEGRDEPLSSNVLKTTLQVVA